LTLYGRSSYIRFANQQELQPSSNFDSPLDFEWLSDARSFTAENIGAQRQSNLQAALFPQPRC
jgi:hypothetical protein